MKANLTGINLNLLLILDALLELKNTTKAGHKLNISQSSISKSLKNLREIFNDELLIRGLHSNRMLLTPKAKSLTQPVKEAIQKISDVFEAKEFDAKTAEYDFKIGMGDSSTAFILPKLIERFNKLSPKSTISVSNINSLESMDIFDDLNLIAAIGVFDDSHANLISEDVHTFKYVCIADKNHTELKDKKMTMDIFIKYPHVIVTHGKSVSLINAQKSIFKKIFEKNKIKYFQIPFLLAALHIIKNTNCLCITSEGIANRFSKLFGFIYKPLPFESPTATIKIYWKKEDYNDAKHKWFRQLIKDVIEERRLERIQLRKISEEKK
jgi:DNA-binding transcriptional LysR family regulator